MSQTRACVDAETVATVAGIRELISKYGVNQTARLTNRSNSSISHIKHGRRHKNTGAMTINALGLRKVEGKLCRRCGNPTLLVTKSHLCIQCEILELAKNGLVEIQEQEDAA